MKASVVDLRYKMGDIIKALDRNETVTILYHGKEKGVLTPVKRHQYQSICAHPFFGMNSEDSESVADTMDRLRGGRY